MNMENIRKKASGAVKKIGKKSVIAVMALLVIGVALLLNFLTMRGTSGIKGLGEEMTDVAHLLENDEGEPAMTDEDYFANIAMNRQNARDEAIAVLTGVTDSDTAVDEVKSSAYTDMQQIADDIESEANIESLISSKGFEQCVAVVNGDSASIIVKTDGLTPGEVAQISEIVYEEAGIIPSELKIIEKN